jgi:hypothetical protein
MYAPTVRPGTDVSVHRRPVADDACSRARGVGEVPVRKQQASGMGVANHVRAPPPESIPWAERISSATDSAPASSSCRRWPLPSLWACSPPFPRRPRPRPTVGRSAARPAPAPDRPWAAARSRRANCRRCSWRSPRTRARVLPRVPLPRIRTVVGVISKTVQERYQPGSIHRRHLTRKPRNCGASLNRGDRI